MALGDVTNLSSEGAYLALSSPLPSPKRASTLGKRAFDALDSDPLDAESYPSKQPMTLGLSGSSSPPQARSSSPFQFAAYEAPTSPSFSPLSELGKLPELPFDDLEDDDSSPELDAAETRGSNVNHPQRAPPALNLPPIDASSPSRSTAAPFKVSLPLDATLQFGRKAKKPAKLATLRGETTLAVLLPKSAKNASRLHCAVKILPVAEEDDDEPLVGENNDKGEEPRKKKRVTVQVEVLGQNGMKVDGQLFKHGQTAHFERKLGKELELDFWGWQALVRVGGTRKERGEKKRQKRTHTRDHSPTPAVAPAVAVAVAEERASTPAPIARAPSAPSSVASGAHSLYSTASRRARNSTPFGHSTRASTPLLAPGATKWDRQFAKMQQQEDDEAEDFVKPTAAAAAPAPLIRSTFASSSASSPAPYSSPAPFAMSSSPAPESRPSRSSSPQRAQRVVEQQSLDLEGLVASAIVFHPRSTVPVEAIIKQMLSDVGGMWDILSGGKGEGNAEREEEAVEAWWTTIEGVLRSEPFFGCIENAGLKDAAGNPLQPEFFYVPEKDAVKSRVEALEPFVKRVRASRTAGGGTRYFWRRPVTKKHK